MCPHSFICLDPLGEGEVCVLCWTGRIFAGTFRLTAEAVREIEQGFVLIPDQPQFYTGKEPLWLKEPPQEGRGRVLPLRDYIHVHSTPGSSQGASRPPGGEKMPPRGLNARLI